MPSVKQYFPLAHSFVVEEVAHLTRDGREPSKEAKECPPYLFMGNTAEVILNQKPLRILGEFGAKKSFCKSVF